MVSKQKDRMIVTNKASVPHTFYPILNTYLIASQRVVKLMLADRTKNSSKFYKGQIPCVISKSLINKYQKNKKCKAVTNLVIPICGDKGRVVKLESNNQLRIPVITKKLCIPIVPLKPIVGHILSVEFFRRKGTWYISYSYETSTTSTICDGFIGIDRNAKANVATLADLDSGKVIRLGPDVKPWKDNLKKRKAKLQSKRTKGANKLLKKINRKQSNRTKDINHKVSKQIVNYAKTHRKSIVLEDLGKIKDSKKCGKFVQKSNWSFYQLETFIKYKASLYCIPVIYVDPKNTSKGCSRCGYINDVSGKAFRCKNCGHKDHRDSNASFNIAARGKNLIGFTDNERELSAGHIDVPLTCQGDLIP